MNINPFVASSECKVYAAPGNQQRRSMLQLRTSCAEVLHFRALPTHFKLLYLLNHSSSLIYLYTSLKTEQCSIKWV